MTDPANAASHGKVCILIAKLQINHTFTLTLLYLGNLNPFIIQFLLFTSILDPDIPSVFSATFIYFTLIVFYHLLPPPKNAASLDVYR